MIEIREAPSTKVGTYTTIEALPSYRSKDVMPAMSAKQIAELLATLSPEEIAKIEAQREITANSGIGGGFITSASIPAREGSLYSELNEVAKGLVDKKVDEIRIHRASGLGIDEKENPKDTANPEYVKENVYSYREMYSKPENLEDLRQAEAAKQEAAAKETIEAGRG